MKRKSHRMEVETHKALGEQLKANEATLYRVWKEMIKAYPKTHPIFRTWQKALDMQDKLRSYPDNRAAIEYPALKWDWWYYGTRKDNTEPDDEI